MESTDKTQTAPPEPAVFAELRALTRRARGGDATALPGIRAILSTHPEIWRHAADLERAVVRRWAEVLGGGDALAVEALRLAAEGLRAELEGEEPTGLEKLLVGQVVGHWLETCHAQIQAADSKGVPIAHASFGLKCAESAQKRYLASMKMLATVRQFMPRGLVPANHLQLHDQSKETA